MKMLTRQGYLLEEQGVSYLADIDSDNPLRSLQAASCTYLVHLSNRAWSARWTECEMDRFCEAPHVRQFVNSPARRIDLGNPPSSN